MGQENVGALGGRPIDRILAGAAADIDLLVGSNTDETCPTAPSTASPRRPIIPVFGALPKASISASIPANALTAQASTSPGLAVAACSVRPEPSAETTTYLSGGQ